MYLDMIEGAKRPDAGSCRGASSLSYLLESSKRDLEDMIGLERVAKARCLQERPWLETEVIAKEDKLKEKYPNKLTDPLSLELLEL